MITILSRRPNDLASPDASRVNKEIIEYCGLSTDEKPTGLIVTGSSFLEVDTGDLYFYNEETAEWLQFINIKNAAGGGGGSGSSSLPVIEDVEFVCDIPMSDELPGAQMGFIQLYDDSQDLPVDVYPDGYRIALLSDYISLLGSSIDVVWDGTAYKNVPCVPVAPPRPSGYWGDDTASVFTNYPFVLTFEGTGFIIATKDDSAHTISISVPVSFGKFTLTLGEDAACDFTVYGSVAYYDPWPIVPIYSYTTILYGGRGYFKFLQAPDFPTITSIVAEDEVGCSWFEDWTVFITAPEASITVTDYTD